MSDHDTVALQSRLNSFKPGKSDTGPGIKDYPEPPGNDRLHKEIAPNWMYEFDTESVEGIDTLRKRIRDAEYSTDRVAAWSKILGDYISYGNAKISKHIAIFNMGAATDCVNIGTEFCQVDANNCYAARNERDFPKPVHYRRKQRIIWDHLDAGTFSKAYRRHYNRKRDDVTAIRFNESGDFRDRHDLFRVDEIANRLSDIVDVFTYSASSWLDWEEISHFTLNQSNGSWGYGHREFIVVDEVEEIPEGGIRCPHDHSDGEIKCGQCTLCIETDAPDVYVKEF